MRKVTMKMWRSVLSVMLALSMMLAPCTSAFATESASDSINYVSLGDSMTNGYCFTGYDQGNISEEQFFNGVNVYGNDAYPNLVAKELEQITGKEVNHSKLAVSAMRAEDLNYLLGGREMPTDRWFSQVERYSGTNGDALKGIYQDAIKEADVISMGIGNAAFGAYMVQYFTRMLGVMDGNLSEEEKVNLEQALEVLEPEQKDVIMEAYNQMMAKAAPYIPSEFGPIDVQEMINMMSYIGVGFILNYEQVLEQIMELNPDAEVILVGLMNTTYGMTVTGEGFDPIPVGDIMDILFGTLNAYIAGLPAAMQAAGQWKDAKFYYAENTDPEFIVQVFDDMYKKGWPDDYNGLSGATVRGRTLEAYNTALRKMIATALRMNLPAVTLEDIENYVFDEAGDQYQIRIEFMKQAAGYNGQNADELPLVNRYIESTNDFMLSNAQTEFAKVFAAEIEKEISIAIYLALEESLAKCVDSMEITLEGLLGIAGDIFSALGEMPGSIDPANNPGPNTIKTGLVGWFTGSETGRAMCKIFAMFKVGDGMSVHPTPEAHAKLADAVIDAYVNGGTANDKTLENLQLAFDQVAALLKEYGPGIAKDAYTWAEKEGYIDELEAKLAELKVQVEAEIENIKEEVRPLIEQKLKELEAELEALKAELADKSADFESMLKDLNAKLDALKADLEAKKAELENAAEDAKAEIEKAIAEIEAMIEAIEKAIEDAKAAIETLEAQIEAVKAEIEAVKEKLAEIDGKVKSLYEAAVELEAAIKELVKITKDGVNAELENAADAIQKVLDKADAAVVATQKALTAVAELVADIQAKAAEIAEEVVAVRNAVAAVYSYYVEALATLNANIQAGLTKINEEILATLISTYEAVAAEAAAQIEALKGELETAIEAVRTEIEAKYAEQIAILEGKIAELEAALAAKREELENAAEEVKEAIEAEIAELEAQLAAAKAELEALLAEIEAEVNAAVATVKAEIEAKIAELEAVAAEVKAALEEAKAAVEAFNAEVEAAIAAIKEAYEEQVAALNAKIAELEAAIAAKKAELENAVGEAKEAIEAEIARLEAELAAAKAELEALLAKIDAEIAAAVEALNAAVEANLEALKSALENAIEDLFDAADEKALELLAALDNAVKGLLTDLYDSVEAELVKAAAALNAKVEEALSELDALILEKVEELNEVVKTQLAALNEEIQATFEAVREAYNKAYYGTVRGKYVLSDDSYYVSIGDSAVTGIGAEAGKVVTAFPELLTKDLKELNANYDYVQLGQDGLRVEDIRYILDETYEADEYSKALGNLENYRETFKEEIGKADLVTVGMGSNNFTTFVTAQIAKILAGEEMYEMDWSKYVTAAGVPYVEAALAEVRAKLAEEGLDKEIDINLAGFGLLIPEELKDFVGDSIKLNVADAFTKVIESYAYAYAGFAFNYTEVLNKIHEINPEALVAVVGGYNPLDGFNIDLLGQGEVSLGEYLDYFMKLIDFHYTAYAMLTPNTLYVTVPETETHFDEANAGEESVSIVKFLLAMIANNGGAMYANADGHAYIKERIIDALIVRASFNEFWLENTEWKFTGEEIRPNVINRFDYVEGVDYEVSYVNNVEPGVDTAKVVVTPLKEDIVGGELPFTIKVVENFTTNNKGNVVPDAENPMPENDFDLSDARIEAMTGYADSLDQVYTGKAVKPAVKVYHGADLLVAGKDYTVSYKNNTKAFVFDKEAYDNMTAKQQKNVKIPTITIKGKGNYTGSQTIHFDILRKDLADVTYTYKDEFVYTGKKLSTSLSLKNGKVSLKNKTDYTVTYLKDGETVKEVKAAGDYTMVVTAKGNNYEGKLELPVKVYPSSEFKALSKLKISTKSVAFGGNIADGVVVKDGKTTLTNGEDYTLTYDEAAVVNAGKHKVVVTGLGKYVGTKSVTVTIKGISLSKATVKGLFKSVVYTGKEYKPNGEVFEVTLKVKEGKKTVTRTLVENRDYVITYSSNVTNKGTVKLTFKGIGNYTGSFTKSFKVDAYKLTDAIANGDIEIVVDDAVVFDRSGAKAGVKVLYKGEELVNGKDYTLSYSNTKKEFDYEPGMSSKKLKSAPKVVVKAKGNFSGSFTAYYDITAKDFTELTVIAPNVNYVSKKGNFKTTVTVMDEKSKKLTSGKDYKVTYVDESGDPIPSKATLNVGDTVIVKVTAVDGKGYTGTQEATINIVPYKLKKLMINKMSFWYTGEAIELTDANGNLVEDDTIKNKIFNRGKLSILSPSTYEALELGEDFKILENTYKNNVKKGTASVTIQGIGNYAGTYTVTYKIVARPTWLNIFDKLAK